MSAVSSMAAGRTLSRLAGVAEDGRQWKVLGETGRMRRSKTVGDRSMPLDRRGLMLGILASATALSGAASAQGVLPDRPVTVVVPFPPGGSVDGEARILAQELGEQTGGTFVVENRAGGAGGAVGSAAGVGGPAGGAALLL